MALRTLTTLGLALALSVPAGPAGAAGTSARESYPFGSGGELRIVGSGWGHGRGMSQWGAHQAAVEGRTHQEILRFYYPGTTLVALGSGTIRVLLAADTGRNLVVRAAPGLTVESDGGGYVLPSSVPQCTKRITLWRVRANSVSNALLARCGRWVKVERIPAPSVTITQPGGLVLTKNGPVRRAYRGAVTATRVGWRQLQVVNTVPMEQYLRSVVAAEVSPSWPEASLRAQAIAARSYAAHERLGRAGGSFDVYDSVRSQYYPGAVEYGRRWVVTRLREHPRTDEAIQATAGVHVTASGAPALTQFSASNGGATAASPLSYMRAEVDGWDQRATQNPRRSWTDSISAAALARRYPSAGRIRAIEVLGREGAGQWGGRITSLRIVGSARSYTVTGDSSIRSVLGTYSSMLTFAAR